MVASSAAFGEPSSRLIGLVGAAPDSITTMSSGTTAPSLIAITSSSGASLGTGRFCGAMASCGAGAGAGLSSAAAGGWEGSTGFSAAAAGGGAVVTVRGVGPDNPRPHTGQAPRPWVANTFSAIAICSSRLARWATGANSPPPWPDQVPGANCSPP